MISIRRKPTDIKQSCKICRKNIKQNDIRVVSEGGYQSINRTRTYYHAECILVSLKLLKDNIDSLPVKELYPGEDDKKLRKNNG